MRPVPVTVGGRELSLRLTLGDLDEIARAERDFMTIATGFTTGRIVWPVVRAILSCALRGQEGALAAFVQERGVQEAHALAGRLFMAALAPEDDEERAGNGEAAAAKPEAGGSGSPATSGPAR